MNLILFCIGSIHSPFTVNSDHKQRTSTCLSSRHLTRSKPILSIIVLKSSYLCVCLQFSLTALSSVLLDSLITSQFLAVKGFCIRSSQVNHRVPESTRRGSTMPCSENHWRAFWRSSVVYISLLEMVKQRQLINASKIWWSSNTWEWHQQMKTAFTKKRTSNSGMLATTQIIIFSGSRLLSKNKKR